MTVRRPALALLLAALAAPAAADEPPDIEHQPVPCTNPGKPLQVCASVTDDGQVAKARVYFRKPGEDFFAFVDMRASSTPSSTTSRRSTTSTNPSASAPTRSP
jgi:hypothetical protein